MASLTVLPALLEHVLTQVGGLRAKRFDRSGSAWEAPLPLNAGAFDDANLLWAGLVATVRHYADVLDLPAPAPARVGWRDDTGVIVGLAKGITPALARHDALTLTRWLEQQQPHLPEDAWMLEDLEATVRTIAARYPLRDRTTKAKGTACPDDGAQLLIRPPRHYGDPQLIVCSKCGATFTEDQHAEIARWYAAVQAQAALKERGDKVRARLAAKYGPAA